MQALPRGLGLALEGEGGGGGEGKFLICTKLCVNLMAKCCHFLEFQVTLGKNGTNARLWVAQGLGLALEGEGGGVGEGKFLICTELCVNLKARLCNFYKNFISH